MTQTLHASAAEISEVFSVEPFVVESLLPFSSFSAFSDGYQTGCQIKIPNMY